MKDLLKDKTPLNEVTRWEILRRSQRESPLRFEKKKFYRAKDFNNVNFEKLFTDDEFVWESRVGDYIVTIAFEGAFDFLKFEYNLKSWRGKNRWKKITLQMLTQSISKALDSEDLFVRCSCPDFLYRFSWWCTQAEMIYGSPQTKAPTVRNVKNNKGYVCKHILSVLYGKRWVPAAAKSWLMYIKANPELTEYYIWGESKKRNRQQPNKVDDDDDLISTELDKSDEEDFKDAE